MIYETIDDAKILTTSFQPNSNDVDGDDDNDDDEAMESTQSYGTESFDCTQCGEIHSDQRSLDAHLRNVSTPFSRMQNSVNCL